MNTFNWKVWILAFFAADFAANVAYEIAHGITGSTNAGGTVAFSAFIWVMFAVITHFNTSKADVLNPPALLLDQSPIRVLAELKDLLATNYFGDKKWSLESMNEQKGTACFSVKVEKAFDSHGKFATVSLNVQVIRLQQATALEMCYVLMTDFLHQHDPLKFCQDTTAYLHEQLRLLNAADKAHLT